MGLFWTLFSILSILVAIFVLSWVLFILWFRYNVNGGFYRRDCKHIKVNLHGKTAIVTGGNIGIGKATAVDLARRGARVIIACRNPHKAERAVTDIQRQSGSSNVLYRHLELSDQESIRNFAEEFLREESRLDYLINNAGILKAAPGHRTKEGYNMVFAVNHFGHFLLTMLLLDRLKASSPSRIVNVSSLASQKVKPGEMHFALKDDKGRVSPGLREYSTSKLANVYFTKELSRRLEGTNVMAFSVHPGVITSNILKRLFETRRPYAITYWFALATFYLSGSNEESGAQTSIHCALDESITHLSGSFFDNCRLAKETELSCDSGMAKKIVGSQLPGNWIIENVAQ